VSLTDFHPNYLTLQAHDDIVVATVTLPHLTDEENTEQLGHEMFALLEQYNCLKVVLSLAPVEYATSSVLGKMISLHRKLHRNGGMLVVCDLSKAVTNVLRTSRLLDYFNVADDTAAAIAALRKK